ncbi:hypothetical protein LNN31_06465 [Acetobacterium wieringae]|jgi:hypothetical protein|uniref:Uncharacterized protein n=1 Tax=Acetobacterium wieringae TaxID=52694 RepID=A0A1F2PIH5_9FIRM|nr:MULTISPECIES: hypothetical protein [Acetobacterium]HAZ05664.1 hypothetical protein [Acetobacterium sp.]MEA4807019.1 hypothetical protein [Acetobacterium wieringae]OFV70516.1 hypothetical protein ACWI_19950 [Acetobacterium wieringae]OXS25015.1 MAG: hypothetical protein BI182_16220 [Acetobacterium sp. MES1]TYC84704.1 hypothetical protein FXB42_10205 [Acetobacterium wieringae]
MEKVTDIRNKYAQEITEILFLLKEVGSGRIYGFPGNCTPGDDELKTNVDTLTEKFNDLLDKIEYGKDFGTGE